MHDTPDTAAVGPEPADPVEMLVTRLLALLPTPAPEASVPRELITREEFAGLLNVALSTFASLESSGGIGPVPIKLGSGDRIVRYSLSEARAWIAASCPARVRWLAMKPANAKRSA